MKTLISRKIAALFAVIFLFSMLSVTSAAGNKKVLHEKTFMVKTGELLQIRAQGGDIGVKAWDKEEVYIKVLGNEKAGKKIKFSFKRTESGVLIEAEKKSIGWFNWGSGIRYRILVQVPKSFNTLLKTSGGDVKLIDLSGEHKVKTSGGDIILKNVSGECELKTSGGDIVSTDSKANIQAATSGGDIKTKRNLGDLSLSTSGGDIVVENTGGKVTAKTSGGDIKIIYSGENKGIYASTSGGDIELFLSPEIKADLILKTSGGEVIVDISNSTAELIKRGKYEGKINGGGEEIKCKTSGGDILVRNQ